MRTKVALLITALALGVFAATLVHAVWYAPEAQVTDASIPVATTAAAQIAQGSADYPLHLIIPKLSVNANVQKVGIAKSGSIAVPSNFTDVAWYKYGVLPGAPGSAVMDGHVDNALSLPGVFKHLDSLTKGDDIYVQTAGGTNLHFVVSDIEIYPVADVPMQDITATTGPPRLALITCDGAWVQSQKMYDQRLVVYANLVS
jgi:LPXTG-site transpeptidase (sortase) family protein